MIAFKTKLAQPYTDSNLKAQLRVIIARVTEINIQEIKEKFYVYWNYFYIDTEGDMVKVFPTTPKEPKIYTFQEVTDYHDTHPTTATLLPAIKDQIFFKSLKSQVVSENVFGLKASDWEVHSG